MTKRAFDCIAAAVGLAVVTPLWLVIAAAIKLDSPGPTLFRHERIGRGFRPFRMYKFRTMFVGAEKGGPITWGGTADIRITRVGRILRAFKLDELPQLVNVVRGDMSLVGPRPEVKEYVELRRDDYEAILRVRPGITDPASLHFADEPRLLAQSHHPQADYVNDLLPKKIAMAKQYIDEASLWLDLRVLYQTIVSIASSASVRDRYGESTLE